MHTFCHDIFIYLHIRATGDLSCIFNNNNVPDNLINGKCNLLNSGGPNNNVQTSRLNSEKFVF